MLKKHALFSLGVMVLALLVWQAPAQSAEIKHLKILSTSPGGIWHALGAHLAEKLQTALPGVSVSNVPGNSSLNHAMVSQGKADIGLSYTPTSIDSYLGRGTYKAPLQNALLVGNVYAQYLHPVVRSGLGIGHISELKDKVVSVGKQSWANTKTVSEILNVWNINARTLPANGGQIQYLGWNDVDAAFQDRRLDAFMYFSSVPSPLLLRLAENPGIDIPPYTQEDVDKILAALEPRGSYEQMQYPANPYKGVKGDFPCPAMWCIIVINKDLPEDVVYTFTKMLYEDADLRAFLGGGTSLNIKYATAGLKNSPIPFHPGAARYLKEKGQL